jgi:hypothetical protein
MPLDHYISQVHLRRFYSPALKGLMYVTRKSDLKSFRCNSKSVCRIEDGSSNSYLRKDRLIEDFLKYIEPRYNRSVAKAKENSFDQESILSLAGFVAYILACSPAAMRIFSDPLKAVAESESIILDRMGEMERAPDSLGGKSITELLAEGIVQWKIDPKFPQALGITSIIGWASVFGNSGWEILHNEDASTPFFTSDFPIGIEQSNDPRVLNKIVPLSPDLAIRICPDIRLSGAKPDLTFKKFTSRQRRLRHREIIEINRCLVRCAEDMIFYRDKFEWVGPFIEKNRYYRVEGVTRRIPHGGGFMNISTQRIVSINSVRSER